MSVAFRRESDDEHKEPRFEIPIPPGPNLVTAHGLALTQARVDELETDFEGDATAIEARKRDLRYWRTRLATAELTPATCRDTVGFGTRVRYNLNGADRSIAIVGDDEADPNGGSIAFSAPLARALIGAAVGECVDFNGKAEAIEILGIEPIEA